MKDTLKDDMTGGLPKDINKVVPTPESDALEITKVVKHGGLIVGYELQNGHQIDKTTAVEMARRGKIKGVGVSISAKGEEYLRSLPDGNESNNLSNLPTITIHA